MSLRSKVVIESNLKPSQFGKPATSDNNDDFEEIYENPLEKSKPLPPRVINGSAIATDLRNNNNNNNNRNSNSRNNQELPRNEPETMEFSNPSKNVNVNLDNNGIAVSIEKPGSSATAGATGMINNAILQQKSNENRDSRNSGIVNEGFDNGGNIVSANNPDHESSKSNFNSNINSNFNNPRNEKLIDVEVFDPNRTSVTSTTDNRNTDRLPQNQAHHDKPDISFRTVANVVRNIKALDVNRYATKKTIAQGMLDIALLTANASQLKYILQIGKQHEFYILMLSLICVSIGLQVLHGIICVLLGSSMNINKQQDHKKANVCNNLCLILMMLTVAVNVVISAFDMRDTSVLTQANATARGSSITQLPSGGR